MLSLHIKRAHVVLAVVLLAGLAIAAPLASASGLAHWFRGFWVGPAAVQAVANNKVTTSTGTAAVTISEVVLDAGTLWTTAAQTATGAVVGDTCETGLPATSLDGGAAQLTVMVDLDCFVSASDAVKWRVKNPTAANLTVPTMAVRARTFSNQ